MSTPSASQVSAFSLSSVSANSALNPRSYTPHTPHTAHPIPLREQAFTLHCQGLRSPAIAAELGVPERTIRSWIAAALDDLKDDLQLNRREQLLLAVERQHQLTAVAWQEFERESTARATLLDVVLDACLHPADTAPDGATSAAAPNLSRLPHLPASVPAPRYLSLILQANKETNRLLGLHTLARLELLTSEPTPIPPGDSENAAESATASSVSACSLLSLSASSALNLRIPAESATAPSEPSPAFRPSTVPAPAFQGRDTTHPAESATGISPLAIEDDGDIVGASTGRPESSEGHIPAESATASASPLTARPPRCNPG